jgi:hypothetical protein
MAIVVYTLCAATSLLCFGLLARAYRANRKPLLLWSSMAFFFFSLGNILLFFDMIIFQNVDLMVYRSALNLVGILMLLPRLVRQSVLDRP